MEWYAVSVFEGNEEKIQDRLKAIFKQSIVTLIPKKRTIFRRGGINKLELNYLFPGYILIQTDMDKAKFEIINKMSGVIRLVNTGKGYTKIFHRICKSIEGDMSNCSRFNMK